MYVGLCASFIHSFIHSFCRFFRPSFVTLLCSFCVQSFLAYFVPHIYMYEFWGFEAVVFVVFGLVCAPPTGFGVSGVADVLRSVAVLFERRWW